MAIARATGSSTFTWGGVNSAVLSYSPAGTGRLLTALGANVRGSGSGSAVPTAQDSSTTAWTVKTNNVTPSAVVFCPFCAYRENNPSGLTSLTLTFAVADSGNFGQATIDEWTGALTSGAFSAQVNDSTATNTAFTSSSIAPADANALILMAAAADDSAVSSWTNPPTGGTPAWTQLHQEGDTTTKAATQGAYQVRAGSAAGQTTTVTYAPSAQGYGMLHTIFLPAATPSAAAPIMSAGLRGPLRRLAPRLIPAVVPASNVITADAQSFGSSQVNALAQIAVSGASQAGAQANALPIITAIGAAFGYSQVDALSIITAQGASQAGAQAVALPVFLVAGQSLGYAQVFGPGSQIITAAGQSFGYAQVAGAGFAITLADGKSLGLAQVVAPPLVVVQGSSAGGAQAAAPGSSTNLQTGQSFGSAQALAGALSTNLQAALAFGYSQVAALAQILTSGLSVGASQVIGTDASAAAGTFPAVAFAHAHAMGVDVSTFVPPTAAKTAGDGTRKRAGFEIEAHSAVDLPTGDARSTFRAPLVSIEISQVQAPPPTAGSALAIVAALRPATNTAAPTTARLPLHVIRVPDLRIKRVPDYRHNISYGEALSLAQRLVAGEVLTLAERRALLRFIHSTRIT